MVRFLQKMMPKECQYHQTQMVELNSNYLMQIPNTAGLRRIHWLQLANNPVITSWVTSGRQMRYQQGLPHLPRLRGTCSHLEIFGFLNQHPFPSWGVNIAMKDTRVWRRKIVALWLQSVSYHSETFVINFTTITTTLFCLQLRYPYLLLPL